MLLDRPIDAEAIDVEIEHPVVAPTIDVPIAIQTSIKAVLVIDRRRAPGVRFPTDVCRSRGCGARSRAFDLASLPQGRGTGGKRLRHSRAVGYWDRARGHSKASNTARALRQSYYSGILRN